MIRKMVRRVVVNKEMRNRVKELKKMGESPLSKGGYSYNSLPLIRERLKGGVYTKKTRLQLEPMV